MALVTAERYNNLRQSVFSVLSTGAGDSGYGQTLTSSAVSTGNLVQASHINNIYEDIRKCYKHQSGGNPTAGQLQEVLTTTIKQIIKVGINTKHLQQLYQQTDLQLT